MKNTATKLAFFGLSIKTFIVQNGKILFLHRSKNKHTNAGYRDLTGDNRYSLMSSIETLNEHSKDSWQKVEDSLNNPKHTPWIDEAISGLSRLSVI